MSDSVFFLSEGVQEFFPFGQYFSRISVNLLGGYLYYILFGNHRKFKIVYTNAIT